MKEEGSEGGAVKGEGGAREGGAVKVEKGTLLFFIPWLCRAAEARQRLKEHRQFHSSLRVCALHVCVCCGVCCV